MHSSGVSASNPVTIQLPFLTSLWKLPPQSSPNIMMSNYPYVFGINPAWSECTAGSSKKKKKKKTDKNEGASNLFRRCWFRTVGFSEKEKLRSEKMQCIAVWYILALATASSWALDKKDWQDSQLAFLFSIYFSGSAVERNHVSERLH